MRKKLKDENKKVKFSITVNPKLFEAISDMENKSKYIEWLMYQDLKKNNKIDEILVL